jgi:hypothetical protein
MNDPDLPNNDEKIVTGGTLKARHFLIIALIAVAIGAVYLWYRNIRTGPAGGPVEGVVVVPEGSRAVTLYFADKEQAILLTETRLVAIGQEIVDQIDKVVEALLDGPQGDGVSTIAAGTRLLDAFYDSETFTLYLDFSSEFVAGHPGGSAAEYFTIAALVRTVSENFPEVRAVQILIEGLQVGTIAGHIDAYKPFLVRDWR